MRNKKLLSSILIYSFSLIFYSNIFAAEENNNEQNSSWLENQLAQTYNNEYNFTLAQKPTDSVALNLKFITLQMEMEENGYGKDYSVIIPDSLDISNNAVDVFNNTYKDINFNLNNVTLPENFNVNSFLQKQKEKIDDDYSDFINDEKFKNLYDSISTSTIINDVESKINNPSKLQDLLVSKAEMAETMSKYTTNWQNNASVEYDKILANYNTLYESKILELDSDSNKQNIIETAKQTMADINNTLTTGFNYPTIDVNSIEKMKTQTQKIFGVTMEDAVNQMFSLYHMKIDSSNSSSEGKTKEELDKNASTNIAYINNAENLLGIGVVYTLNETNPYVTITNENTTDNVKKLIFYRELLRENSNDAMVLRKYNTLSPTEKSEKMANFIANNYSSGISLPTDLNDKQIENWIKFYQYCIDNNKPYNPNVSVNENTATKNLTYYTEWFNSSYCDQSNVEGNGE